MANQSYDEVMNHVDRRAKPKGITFDRSVNVSSLLAIIGLIGTMLAGVITTSRQAQKMDDWKQAQDVRSAIQDAQISKLTEIQTQTEKNAAVLTQIVLDMKEQRKP